MEKIGTLLGFVVCFIFIGAANNQHEWLGSLVGAIIGLFFGCAFTGLMPKWLLNALFPPSSHDRM